MTKSSAQETRKHIVDAALEALKRHGFAGATSRAIAREGGFNQALIFYHFGNLDALLLAALDQTSEERLDRYREAVARASSFAELAEAAAEIYREDRGSGHVTVVAQMFAGSLARPSLAPHVMARMEPWLAFAEDTIAGVLEGSPLAEIVPAKELAYGVVTFYLGVNLLTHLDEEHSRTDALFQRVVEAATAVSAGTPPT